MFIEDLQQQKIEWRKKGWAIPDIRGSKQDWYYLIKELIRLVADNLATDLDSHPDINGVSETYTWRSYASFLKSMGLVSNRAGILSLTETGRSFYNNSSKRHLADLIQDKVRLFGEVLVFLQTYAKRIEEVDKQLCETFCLSWANLSNTRRRMDWLEVLGLIQDVGNRKWGLTPEGQSAINDWRLVTADVLDLLESDSSDIVIAEPPEEIASLLQHLFDIPDDHKKRSTYNIWVPSPNRINNLRIIVQFALERVSRADLFKFVEDEFSLKTSSVESMLPFLKAAGLLEEVGRNVYIATSASKAWCETGNDLDFIRILHCHMRFVGEMIQAAENDSIRNDIYAQAKNYGLNTEKARWIAGFLLEAGLLEEPRYLHLKATSLGKQFVSRLPLSNEVFNIEGETNADESKEPVVAAKPERTMADELFARLGESSKDPMAFGKASGVAFEESIAETFCYMGFDAKRIGGAGDTDVIIRWKDSEGKNIIAIADGKSKSSGTVSHSDISDVAIDMHKEKNNADYVAIVGASFSGDTIRNHARKKKFALITVEELIEVARSTHALGLSLDEIAYIFQVPDGLSKLDELMEAKRRQMDIITLVISQFRQEQELLGNLSARDLYLLLRATAISPTLEELMDVFDILSKQEIGILVLVSKASASENSTYMLAHGKSAVNRLRAIVSAIESGL